MQPAACPQKPPLQTEMPQQSAELLQCFPASTHWAVDRSQTSPTQSEVPQQSPLEAQWAPAATH